MANAPQQASGLPTPDFQTLFEAAPGLHLVLLPDAPRFTIVAVSHAYAHATMTRREALLGRGLFEVFPDDPSDPLADGVRNLRASLERAIASGAPDAMAVQKYSIRRPDSNEQDFEERWWSPLNTPVLDANRQVVYLIHRVEDVTEFRRLKQKGMEHEQVATALRERAQQMELDIFQRGQQLQKANEQLRELFEQAFDGIFIAGPDGRFNEINGAGCVLMGEARESLQGKTSFDLTVPEQHERLEEVRQALISGQDQTHVHEWLLRRQDGSLLPVEVKARRLSDGRLVSFVRDISAHKRELRARESMAEQLETHVRRRTEQLRRMGADLEAAEDRERRKIAHDLHDDLGQTLAAARIWLASLCSHPLPDVQQPAREVDKLIERANRSTRSLAAQLAPAMLYELGLSPALEWLGEDIRKTFGMKVTVIDDGQSKPLTQNVRSILYRAIRELLINAAKHACSPSATVHTAQKGNRIVVHVSDTGIGFDPTRVLRSPDGGMGLVSVRERLSFIDGTAEIHSEPGKGTEVILTALLAPHAPEGTLENAEALDVNSTDALQSIIDALAGRVAVFDHQGHIRCVNRAWQEFAQAHGNEGGIHCGPGANYLDICRRGEEHDPHSAQALQGLMAVMRGDLAEFSHIYPCHTIGKQQWFMMHAAPLIDGDCLVTHIELSSWVDPHRMAELDLKTRAL